jgi:putative ABC transport system permease protein
MLQDSLRYAARSLARRRLRSWLTIIGVLIGIAAVVSLISLGQGMRDAIGMQFSTLGADRIVIQPKGAMGFGPPGLGAGVEIDQTDLAVVQRAQYVDGAAGQIIRPVTVQHNRRSTTAIVGTLPQNRADRSVVEGFLNPTPVSGRLLQAQDRGGIVLGGAFLEGEQMANALGGGAEAGQRINIEGQRYEVIGVLAKTGIPSSDFRIWMNDEDARELFSMEDQYTFIVARAASFDRVQDASIAIEEDLRRHRSVSERNQDFEVDTSEDILRSVDDILSVVTGVLVGIAAISLLVGGIGIMNTMYTAVLERKKEIGIMKAVGATNQQVMSLFLIESGMLGMIGALIGVLLGAGFAKLVEFGAAQALGPNVLQASVPLWLVLGSLAFGFVVGAASGTFPARQAAALQPVEALE